MMFFDGPRGFEELASRCVASSNARFYVAFWGFGAAERLGIKKDRSLTRRRRLS